jgi:hypothetical protein
MDGTPAVALPPYTDTATSSGTKPATVFREKNLRRLLLAGVVLLFAMGATAFSIHWYAGGQFVGSINWQASGAVIGGLVGGFSAFLANHLHRHHDLSRARRNVASALMGEIEVLVLGVQSIYMVNADAHVHALSEEKSYPNFHFRAERDYTPVFKGVAGNLGVLPNPLPRDLVSWYARLAICLEWARELHELARNRDPDFIDRTTEIAKLQHAEFTELLRSAEPLVDSLSRI